MATITESMIRKQLRRRDEAKASTPLRTAKNDADLAAKAEKQLAEQQAAAPKKFVLVNGDEVREFIPEGATCRIIYRVRGRILNETRMTIEGARGKYQRLVEHNGYKRW